MEYCGRIESVQDLLNYIERIKNKYGRQSNYDYPEFTIASIDFCYRGMKDSAYKLMPRAQNEILCEVKYEDFDKPLEYFQKESSGYLRNICGTDKLLWMQYAQHYGVPTRLLDFTANPLVALYFACNDGENDGVLWMLNIHNYEFAAHHKYLEVYDREMVMEQEYFERVFDTAWRDILYPFYFVPDYIDQRMNAQSSRFLLWPYVSFPLEDLIADENCMTISVNDHKARFSRYAAKFLVPSDRKIRLLQELDTLGISQKSLFPGLDSIGYYVNRLFDPKYSLDND